MPNVSDFQSQVLDRLTLPGPSGPLSYLDYLKLSATDRSGDESAVVDDQFTRLLLQWLGWEAGDWRYNSGKASTSALRPDFRVLAQGRTAFLVEDKSTSLDWTPAFLPQMRGYAKGTSGLVLWTNAREVRLFRFQSSGTFIPLAVVDIEALAQGATLPGIQTQALEVIVDALAKQRYIGFQDLCDSACADRDRIPLDDPSALDGYISGAQVALQQIGKAATVQVRAALDIVQELRRTENDLLRRFDAASDILLRSGWTADNSLKLNEWIRAIRPHLGAVSQEQMNFSHQTKIKPKGPQEKASQEFVSKLAAIDSEWRLYEIDRHLQELIEDAYSLWTRKQPNVDLATVERFADQAAYISFVRLMLVRILEDKSVLPVRVASNGGFGAWVELVQTVFVPGSDITPGNAFGAEFISMVVQTVSTYYSFDAKLFSWFQIDDYGLVQLLDHLNQYDFSEITTDVIGFTYESYIERSSKSEKGQFLTRGGLVDFLLDSIDYEGPSVIGRRLLDHACGSGSFLVHAARRLRMAIAVGSVQLGKARSTDELMGPNHPERRAFAKEFLKRLPDLVGLEIDPFSCYLAELNLLIQALDDLAVLWGTGDDLTFEHLSVFNTNSLELPESILDSSINGTPTLPSAHGANPLDAAWSVKALKDDWDQGFDFVAANPPFISSKKQPSIADFATRAFFRDDALSGDTNTYLLFFRLAEHFLADGGRAGIISPVGLCGDESGLAIRRLCTTDRLRLRSLTRFTSSTVLFDDVDQWTMITTFEAGPPSRRDPDVEVRYGFNEQDAATASSTIPAGFITNLEPSGDQSRLSEKVRWRNPWLLLGETDEYDLVKAACGQEGWLGDQFHGVGEWRQGDVNATGANPFRRRTAGPDRLPLLTGGTFQPWSPLRPSTEWVEAPSADPSSGIGSQLWHLANLQSPECGFVMGVQQNLHVRHRLRGTWYDRDSSSSFAFTHSVWRVQSLPKQSDALRALLALLNSDLVNFLFSAWSTNFNVGQAQIFRLPCPTTPLPASDLNSAALSALAARSDIENWELSGRGSYKPGHLSVDPEQVLSTLGIPKVSLSDALLSGDLLVEQGSSGRIDRIINENRLSSTTPGYAEAVGPLLLAAGPAAQLVAASASVSLPRVDRLAEWDRAINVALETAQGYVGAFDTAQEDVNSSVSSWYGLSAGQRAVAARGLPWEYKRARRRHKQLNPQTP